MDLLDHYLIVWQLTEPALLAQTPTSDVYRVMRDGEHVVLKVLTPLGVKDEANGVLALSHFDGQGAVRLLRSDEGAHLLEYADGDDLTVLVRQGEDEQATAIIGDVLKTLHSAPGPLPEGLRSLRRWFRALFTMADADPLYGRAARVAEALLAEPRDVRVLHGDIHHENVRYHSGRGWLAIDPKGIVGERTYDAANTLCNPLGMPELVHDEGRLLRNAEILATKLDIPLDRLLRFTYAFACLSACWSLTDGDDPNYALAVARIIEPHTGEQLS